MKWRYGVIKYYYHDDLNNPYYGIGEIYFDEDNKAYACSEKPTTFIFDTEEQESEEDIKRSFRSQLEMALSDCNNKDIFDTAIFINKK